MEKVSDIRNDRLIALYWLYSSISYWYHAVGALYDPPVFICNYSHSPEIDSWDGSNTLVFHTGHWRFLRILFPYVYRELRKNRGVLDRVLFMMVNYDNETLDNNFVAPDKNGT